MARDSYANSEVLDFYKALPFNQKSSLEEEIAVIRNRTPQDLYPGLARLLSPKASVLEVGSGVGWLSNSINFLYKSPVLGIDFNPVAVGFAQEVAKRMGLRTRFEVQDLFVFEPSEPFDVVLSFGVLHHTDNCGAAVARLCEKFVKPGGQVMIGLYHKYGRRPFLDYFDEMKKSGATQEQMVTRYRTMMPYLKDETHLLSWFRDQVMHPHETQHTLKEILPILESSGMEFISTSINHFQPFRSLSKLLAREEEYEVIARDNLKNNKYFPGFFIFIAKKKV